MSPITQSVRAIPPHKRGPKLVKTLAGVVLFVGGLLTPKYLGYPWQVGAAIAGFGGFLVSQDLVIAYAKVVPAAVGAFVRALSGKNGEQP